MEYGPVGMTIDPVTGRITWSGKAPMFGPEMSVRWHVGSSSEPALGSAGALRLVDPARPYPYMRTPVRRPSRARLFVADFDADGDEEVLVHDVFRKVYTIAWDGEDYSQSWAYPFEVHEFGIDAVVTADLDDDAALEIVVSGGYAYDGSTYALEWSHPSTANSARIRDGSVHDVAMVDLDGDGVEEILGYLDKEMSYRRLDALRIPSGEVLGASQPLPNYFDRMPSILDVDRDGIPEIFGVTRQGIMAYRYDPRADEFVQIAQLETLHHADAFAAGDLDGDGRGEIIWGGEHKGFKEVGSYSVAEFDGDFHAEWTQSTDQLYDDIFIGGHPVSDGVTASGRLLFVSGAPVRLQANPHSDAPRIVYLSPSTGKVTVGSRVDSGHLPLQGRRWYIGDAATIDYDRDGSHEVLLSMHHDFNMGRLVAFDPFLAVDEWSVAGDEFLNYPFQSADINGDGFDDLLTRTGAYDMVHDALIWEPEPRSLEGPRMAAGDLDGDGHAEIVYTDLFDRLVILSPTGTETDSPPRVVALDHDRIFDMIADDTDGDGKAEILLVSNQTGHLETQAIWRFDETGEPLNSFPVGIEPLLDPVRLFVLPGAGRKQVVLTFNSFFETTTKLVSYDPVTGARLWESPTLLGVVSPDSLHYVDVEGAPRLAIGTTRAMYVTQ